MPERRHVVGGFSKKKPFSGKQKKAQLAEKKSRRRLTDSQDARDEELHPTTSFADAEYTTDESSTAVVYEGPSQPMDRFALLLGKESKDVVRKRVREAQTPLAVLPKSSGLQASVEDYHAGSAGGFLEKPPWHSDMTMEELDHTQEAALVAYIEQLRAESIARGRDGPSYFESNLETWRQLWHVLEVSDVLLFIVDVRYAALHFSPAMYDYITGKLHKKFILVINKCDLVDQSLVSSWRKYFQARYPGLQVIEFSSWEATSSKKRHRRQRKVANGLDMLAAAWRALHLPCYAALQRVLRQRHEEHPDVNRPPDQSSDTGADADGETSAGEDHSRRSSTAAEDREDRGCPTATGNATSPLPAALEELFAELEGGGNASDGDADVFSELVLDTEQPAHWEAEPHCDPSTTESTDQRVTVGLIGQPNVGKSTVLNALMGRIVVKASITPGRTKHYQTHVLTGGYHGDTNTDVGDEIVLCDCPGLVLPTSAPKSLQVLAGLYPIAQLQEAYSAIRFLAERIDLVSLLKLHVPENEADNPDFEWTAWHVVESWAERRRYFTRGGRLDMHRAANEMLRNAVEGRVVLALQPPATRRQ